MRILVDTSVWSLAFRKQGPDQHPAVSQLRTFIEEQEEIVLIGLIIQEILQAFRNESTIEKVTTYLGVFPIIKLERSDFIEAARLFRRSRAKGLTVSTPDCQIAAAAISYECSLLTTDQDFYRLTNICSLQLL